MICLMRIAIFCSQTFHSLLFCSAVSNLDYVTLNCDVFFILHYGSF